MKIGILTTSRGNLGEKGLYNSQEIGLAKALSTMAESVFVYKLISSDRKEYMEEVEGYKNVRIRFFPSKQLGVHGFFDMRRIDDGLNALIYFSDTQLFFPSVYRWAEKNSVKFFSYAGVLESHSTSPIKRCIMDLLLYRSLKVYRKTNCLTKTPYVQEQLKKYGVKNTTVCPVGLDLSLLDKGINEACALTFKKKHGYRNEDKVILFIGRMTEEKKPLQMLEVFSELLKKDENYKLLMIGKGELKTAVVEEVRRRGLSSKVTLIDMMPNREVLELYRFAHVFVNLNEQEIFGMAILEAMYYNCKVIAWKAPGPGFIIENGISGWLVESKKEIIEKVEEPLKEKQGPHNRIVNRFTWDYTAGVIGELLNGERFFKRNEDIG